MSYMAVFATEREIQNGWGFCGDNMFPKFWRFPIFSCMKTAEGL